MESLVSVERAKIRLRLTVLSAFLFWAALGLAAWWYVTSITRSPIPALSSFPTAERVASQLAEGSQGRGEAARRKAATAAYARWEAAHTKRRREGREASSVPPFFALLPPLVTGFSLKLVPLCEEARRDAASFFDWLQAKAASLRNSGLVSLPAEPRVYGSLFLGLRLDEGGEGEAAQTAEPTPAFVTDLNLILASADPAPPGDQGATSTSLLRVVLAAPPRGASCACAPGDLELDEAELTYTIAFSTGSRELVEQTGDHSPEAADSFSAHFVLHSDSSISVASVHSSDGASSSFRDKAGVTFPALAQLLRLSFFSPLDEAAFRFPFSSQYDLTFWLGGDPLPSAPQGQETREESEGAHAASGRRLTWRFKRDGYDSFLESFFSRLSFVFNFQHMQSQVVPHSSIASLLKRPETPASPWLLDLASQHKLHAVASNWQPEQIITTPTHAPAPAINFAVYRSPVPLVLKDGKPGRRIAASQEAGAGARTETLNGIAIPGWGGLVIASPASTVFSDAAVTRFSSEEMRQICGVWVAQLRSFFSLPETLEDYFSGAAAERAADHWRMHIVASPAERQTLLARALNLEKREARQVDDVVMVWTHRGEKQDDTEDKVLVVAQHTDAGLGLWEVWRLARRVYVQLVERAVSNIRSLQTIIEDQTELAVYPHVGEALQVQLTGNRLTITSGKGFFLKRWHLQTHAYTQGCIHTYRERDTELGCLYLIAGVIFSILGTPRTVLLIRRASE
ncbi:UBA/TS-N domain-containing protein [Toxoplasma gondii TgCatPRC2]|uniref:UBA/TS-N domain-containing protein n=1 Tax=Toxoplasma gondii TgCatPRC2 TaxID=1130821 RepID=A0A151H2P1_TOXGO|nr:UBA/TS-N domain-containing protein [Toxoplasma gondii TgCatPRC2]